MSVLDQPVNQEPTLEEKQAVVRENLTNIARRTFDGMLRSHNDAIRAVWNNPMGLTPEEVVAGLDTDAAELFSLTYQLAAFVNQVKADTINFTMPMEATLNPDGTVTLSERV